MFGVESAATPLLWASFLTLVVVMLLVDLLFINRKAHVIETKEAAKQSLVWIGLSVIVGGIIWAVLGSNLGAQYFTGYIIEKSLSVDNIFVWGLVLSFFKIPAKYRHRILFWGIFGALIMRFIFIVAGVAVINKFEFVVPLLGLVLLYSAYKIIKSGDDEDYDVKNSKSYKFFTKYVPTVKTMDGSFIKKLPTSTKGQHALKFKYFATPLLICLLVIEVTDVIFAVDSVPAILSVASDPFVIFASNAMAILGLRALFFLFDSIKDKFEYLGTGVAVVLGFVGIKMILQSHINLGLFHLPGYHIPTLISLSVVTGILAGSVILSTIKPSEK